MQPNTIRGIFTMSQKTSNPLRKLKDNITVMSGTGKKKRNGFRDDGGDGFEFIDDENGNNGGNNGTTQSNDWHVLVVDDDPDVHDATIFALQKIKIFGKNIKFYHANSAEEGLKTLQKHDNISVALLDAVMETPDAGLKLVKKIRDLGLTSLRIILRTGQPGYAPEESVIRDYDINEYCTKTELTRTRLISVLTAAFRAYNQIEEINENLKDLEILIDGIAGVFKSTSPTELGEQILELVPRLLPYAKGGLVCTAETTTEASEIPEMTICAATGIFSGHDGETLEKAAPDGLISSLAHLRMDDEMVLLSSPVALYFNNGQGESLLVHIAHDRPLSETQHMMLQILGANIAIGFQNITLIRRLDRLAFVDPVSHMPNLNALGDALQKQTNPREKLSLILLHVKALSAFHSAFGMDFTNKALAKMQKRLQDLLKSAYLIARYDSAKFAVLAGQDSMNEAAILEAFSTPVSVDDTEISFSAAAAVTEIAEGEPEDVPTLLRRANSAILTVKHKPGTHITSYDPSVTKELEERLKTQEALRSALESGEGLHAHFQPKIDLEMETITGTEALCRWTLDGKPISPGVFIPVAEKSGLAERITDVMLGETAAFIRAREKKKLPPLPVAVNLSMYEIGRKNFAETLLEKIEDKKLTPDMLEFEVTESVMMHAPEHNIRQLEILKNKGFRIALDDFGTGYSSLRYLEEMPLDILKIDRSFIIKLNTANAGKSLAASAIALANIRELKTVAEGIETRLQHDALKTLGCTSCQGFLYGHPLAADDFHTIYKDWTIQDALTETAKPAHKKKK
ncbi:MAG: EAL domain-containing protein [Micavibrio sp.]|nr:MAG: EAL domain-containing protein [Micavibrio sp.]